MQRKTFSILLVTSQFSCIGILIFTQHLSSLGLPSFILMTIGVFIGLWAIYAMRKSHLNVMPDLKTGSSIIISGPYRFLRHPMYLAVIIFSLSLVINNGSVFGIGVLVFLIITLLVKVEYEEKQLISGLSGYKAYMQKTKKLIPFVY